MKENELIIDEKCLPVATAVVRSPEALAEFYTLTLGPLRWSAEFQAEGENLFVNTYSLYRRNADGNGVIKLTLIESVIISTSSETSREVVVDRPGERLAIDSFPADAQASEALDSFCSFLARYAASLNESLVEPYLAAKAVTLEDGQQGIVRDHGALKFVVVTSDDGSLVDEVRLYGIDLSSVGDTGAAADLWHTLDGYENFLRIRPPLESVEESFSLSGVRVESQAIANNIDATALDAPEPEFEPRESFEALEALGTFEDSDFVPPYFMTSKKVLEQADPIPDPDLITSNGGQIRDIQHFENTNACLRMIHLPRSLKATKSAARILAESGAVQNGDVLLSFRPNWSRTNAYGNIQLGLSHTGLALIDPRGGRRVVQTLESPINYSSNLNYSGHYGDLDFIHILRPALTSVQKLNLRKWAAQILLKCQGNMSFFGNYGSPYFSRQTPHSDPISIIEKLAKIVQTQSGDLASYCSEFVWAVLGLRDCEPDTYAPNQGMEKPFFDPLTAAEERLLMDPGLIQGPDLALRQAELADGPRRAMMTDRVLHDIVQNPSELVGTMSSGHREAARLNQPKIDQLAAYYHSGESSDWLGKSWSDSSNPQTNLNFGVVPNYSPTSFFIMTNSDAVNEGGEKLMKYIGTIAYASI
ncbi:hypothetical protein V2O64_24795 (plasmid) [Verrucomicrobiaceae bacterium 227]